MTSSASCGHVTSSRLDCCHTELNRQSYPKARVPKYRSLFQVLSVLSNISFALVHVTDLRRDLTRVQHWLGEGESSAAVAAMPPVVHTHREYPRRCAHVRY